MYVENGTSNAPPEKIQYKYLKILYKYLKKTGMRNVRRKWNINCAPRISEVTQIQPIEIHMLPVRRFQWVSVATFTCVCVRVCVYEREREREREPVRRFQWVDRKNPPPPGGFSIYYVPWSRAVCKRFHDRIRRSHLVVICKVLQHVAMWCTVLQCVAGYDGRISSWNLFVVSCREISHTRLLIREHSK